MMHNDDLLPGTLDLMVLSTLRRGELHGYAIARSIEKRSQDVLQVGQGSLYPALARLEKAGKIRSRRGTSETGRRVRLFRLTTAGERALIDKREGWSRLIGAVERVLGTL